MIIDFLDMAYFIQSQSAYVCVYVVLSKSM